MKERKEKMRLFQVSLEERWREGKGKRQYKCSQRRRERERGYKWERGEEKRAPPTHTSKGASGPPFSLPLSLSNI